MTPKFANPIAWQQAELLMQPVFIRVIDNLRKELERSTWKGTYENVQIWEEGVPEATKAIVTRLQQEMEKAEPEEAAAIEQQLTRLPRPVPGYHLNLEHQDRKVTIDLWELCYQICFRNYNPIINASSNQTVEVDTSLIDEMGEVDWVQLDEKAKRLIGQIFANLPDR